MHLGFSIYKKKKREHWIQYAAELLNKQSYCGRKIHALNMAITRCLHAQKVLISGGPPAG